MWFLSFSGKNDADSLWNFVKNLILNPKRIKFDQKSWFCHVRIWKILIWSCPDLKSPDLDMSGPENVMSGPEKSWFGHVRTCPGGQVLTSKQRKYFYFLRFYTFPFFISKFIIFFIKSCVFISKFIFFIKWKTFMGPYGPQPGPGPWK